MRFRSYWSGPPVSIVSPQEDVAVASRKPVEELPLVLRVVAGIPPLGVLHGLITRFLGFPVDAFELLEGLGFVVFREDDRRDLDHVSMLGSRGLLVFLNDVFYSRAGHVVDEQLLHLVLGDGYLLGAQEARVVMVLRLVIALVVDINLLADRAAKRAAVLEAAVASHLQLFCNQPQIDFCQDFKLRALDAFIVDDLKELRFQELFQHVVGLELLNERKEPPILFNLLRGFWVSRVLAFAEAETGGLKLIAPVFLEVVAHLVKEFLRKLGVDCLGDQLAECAVNVAVRVGEEENELIDFLFFVGLVVVWRLHVSFEVREQLFLVDRGFALLGNCKTQLNRQLRILRFLEHDLQFLHGFLHFLALDELAEQGVDPQFEHLDDDSGLLLAQLEIKVGLLHVRPDVLVLEYLWAAGVLLDDLFLLERSDELVHVSVDQQRLEEVRRHNLPVFLLVKCEVLENLLCLTDALAERGRVIFLSDCLIEQIHQPSVCKFKELHTLLFHVFGRGDLLVLGREEESHLGRQQQMRERIFKLSLARELNVFQQGLFAGPDFRDAWVEEVRGLLDALEVIRSALACHRVELRAKSCAVVLAEVDLRRQLLLFLFALQPLVPLRKVLIEVFFLDEFVIREYLVVSEKVLIPFPELVLLVIGCLVVVILELDEGVGELLLVAVPVGEHCLKLLGFLCHPFRQRINNVVEDNCDGGLVLLSGLFFDHRVRLVELFDHLHLEVVVLLLDHQLSGQLVVVSELEGEVVQDDRVVHTLDLVGNIFHFTGLRAHDSEKLVPQVVSFLYVLKGVPADVTLIDEQRLDELLNQRARDHIGEALDLHALLREAEAPEGCLRHSVEVLLADGDAKVDGLVLTVADALVDEHGAYIERVAVVVGVVLLIPKDHVDHDRKDLEQLIVLKVHRVDRGHVRNADASGGHLAVLRAVLSADSELLGAEPFRVEKEHEVKLASVGFPQFLAQNDRQHEDSLGAAACGDREFEVVLGVEEG